MILHSLEIQGFKCFDASQTISFNSNTPGLYFLTGENQTQPSLGANGAGKTSILDALCWVLFDKTTRGLKAKNIKNWAGSEKVVVSLQFESRLGNALNLVRTWSPNSLKWSKLGESLETVTQEELENEIGLNYETFIQTIIIPQFASMFFDKKPSEQASLLTEILDIKEWLDYSDAAKSILLEQKSRAADVQSDLDKIKGQLIQLQDMSLLRDKEEWDSSKALKIREQKAVITSLKGNVQKLKNESPEEADTSAFEAEKKEIENEITRIADAMQDCQSDSLECRNSIADIESDLKSVQKSLQGFDTKISNLKTEIRLHNKSIEKIQSLEGVCPTCGQDVDANHIEVEIKPLLEKIEDLTNAIKELEIQKSTDSAKESELQDELKEAKEISSQIRDDLEKLRDENSKLERRLYRVQNQISEASLILKNHLQLIKSAENQVASAERWLAEIEDEANPYVDQIERNAARKQLLLDQEKESTEALKEAIEEITMLEYWVKHFKNIRTFCISQALMQLEVEVNTNLAKLGLSDWAIHFDVERETSSNTIKKEFQVLIDSPHNDGLVPWESWSGGESQRLRIAGTTGLASLILARKGITTNVEFWDEPTNGLNQKGVEDLMSTLSDHAKDNGKQVWVVDHRSLSFGNFKKAVCVRKTKSGSIIEEIEN